MAIALAALVGMGTKAGVMPLHVWLPRAHPIAPAPVSALMSGVMIKVALYGLVRVLVDWVGVLPVWFGVLVLAVGALSAVGGVVYALFQHDLKRLLALHSIENVGIIVLGLGACLVLRARGADAWAAFALGAALLHTVNHAVFKALLFLGAGAFERAVGSLELDRLGGLLRRMPWTGGAFLVGAMAIAGLPPLNGFASEWLTLQALLHVAAYGQRRRRDRGRARARARSRRRPRWRSSASSRSSASCCSGPPRTRRGRRGGRGARCRCGRRSSSSPAACVVLGLAPGLLFGALVGLAPWSAGLPAHAGLELPGTGSLLGHLDRGRPRGVTGALVLARGRRGAAPAPSWACRPAGRARAPVDERRLHEAAPARARGGAAPAAGDRGAERGRRPAGGLYSGHVPQLIDDRVYAPVARALARGGRAGQTAAERQPRHVCRVPRGLVLVLLAAARLGWIG